MTVGRDHGRRRGAAPTETRQGDATMDTMTPLGWAILGAVALAKIGLAVHTGVFTL
jgi:hypothetical protein